MKLLKRKIPFRDQPEHRTNIRCSIWFQEKCYQIVTAEQPAGEDA